MLRLASSLFVAALLACAALLSAPALSCTAPGGGEPSCGGAGPASVGGGGFASVMVGGGNPINLLSGNKYQEETDLPALPGVLGLELKRYYNSESSYPGLAGAQWRTSYETVLYDLGNQVQIVQADGRRITLQRGVGAKAQLCTSAQPQDGEVRIEQQGNERVFHWRWADGRTLSFRSAGPGESSGYPLHSIQAPTGERTQLAYNPLGDLVRVTDPQGRQLVLGYGRSVSGRRALLQTATTPLGRIAYRHDDQGRLTEVAYSASDAATPYRTRIYHYEAEYNAGNTFALTGISDKTSGTTQRLSTYAYDVRGRAILSTKGLPLRPGKAGTGIGQISLQYLQAPSPNEGTADRTGEVQPRPQGLGKVVLTNSLGQTSTLLTAIIGGQLRLIEFTGAGCSSCGPANRRYAYDSAGRLLRTIELDAQGHPTRAQLQRYDAAGRIAHVSEQAYRDGAPVGVPQPLRRYDYADARSTRPAQLTERSVIAGKERITRLEYNEFGQLTRLVQAGWSPVDAQGGLVAQGVPVNRTTVYRYTVTGGHSVLAEIDGRAVPRAEAAEAATTALAGLHTPDPMAATPDLAATDDMAARQRSWRDADGITFLRATWGGAGTAEEGLVVAWEAGARRAERRFDDLQRLVAVRNPGEGWRTAVYDAAGRLALTRDPRGATQRLQRGADGELQRLEHWDAGASSASAVTEWRRDASGLREVSLRDADGIRRTLYERDAQGRVIAETLRIAPSGPLTGALPAPISLSLRYERGADGRIEARTLVDQAGRSSRWTQSYDERGLVSRMDTRGSVPAWLGGTRPLLREVEWAAPARAEFASRLLHGDGTEDRFGNPAEASPRSTASTPSASADTSPQRDDEGLDAAGLPATAHTDSGALQLGWNAAAQLVSVRRTDGSSRYVYDALGRRVVSVATGRESRVTAEVSLYEESRLVAQADAAGNAQRAYVYLGLRPVAQLDLAPQSGWAQLMATWRGAPVLQLHTDPAGRVVSTSRDGQTLAADLQPLRDVGQRHDEDTGLAYHGARFLNPRTGRFLSPDPQGIADAVQGVTRPHLLDTYAYAGGRPDLYIDPDGAARIRYFAITTGANGRALGDNQGFTKARWAFIIDQVGGGGDASTALGRKRNEYAANGTGLLFDKEGDFLAAGKSSETWTGGSAGVPDLFTDHYGNHLISVPAFTINNFDDDRAASVIASLIPADRATVFPGACPAYSLLLPPIHFADEQTDIDVTRTDPARKQRILACGAGSATSLEQRRISTYEAAAELNETSRPKRINKDCSADGCPGVYYSCNATRCVGTNGPPAGGGTSYVASYGRSQFIGSTLVSELINAYGTFTAAERTELGMGPTALADLNAADSRGRNLLTWFNTRIAAAPSYAAAANAWDNLPAARRAQFTADTGLGERAYEDIVRLKTSPPTNSNGTSLLGDARQAMVTEAIMGDAAMRTLLMGIFQNFDRFTVMGRKLMQNNLNRVLAAYPGADDEEVAARVARLHNGGNWRAPLATLKGAGDSFNYVKRFLGDIHGEGEWRSLRCVEDFGTGVTTVAPGTAGSDVGGLEMKPLTIP